MCSLTLFPVSILVQCVTMSSVHTKVDQEHFGVYFSNSSSSDEYNFTVSKKSVKCYVWINIFIDDLALVC